VTAAASGPNGLRAHVPTARDCADWFANLAADGGMAAVHEALRGPLPTPVEFVRLASRKPKVEAETKASTDK